MTYKIVDIQGVGPEFADRLGHFGIHTTDDLANAVADPRKLAAMVETTGIGETLLQKWASMARLMRVHGIGPQYAELLQATGIDTIEQLRDQSVDGLIRRMTEVNAVRNLTNALPKPTDVHRWMESVHTLTAGVPAPPR